MDAADPDDSPPCDGDAETLPGAGPLPRRRAVKHVGPLPEAIGPFKILRIVASGGMGTVFEATQEHPSRTVAVKVMRPEMLGEDTLRRFHVEADLLARLTHPGIAQVYQAGSYEVDGVDMPYFAMEFIHDALTITEYARGNGLDARQRLELFAEVCEAVQFGHQRGVIHRDIKPDNILIEAHSQTPRPKVIDFGVARATDADVAAATMQTTVGQLVGTLHYMSPEQVAADPSEIDVRSDVYALGMVLHELLTGRLPYDFKGAHFIEVMRIIREDQPTKLSTTTRGLRGDVETIVLKALEKEKSRRYQTAAELLADVRAFLSGAPISARPPSTLYQIQTFARRNRAAFTALLVVFVVSIVAAVVSVRWALRADSLARAERASRSRIERQLYRSNLNGAADSLNGGRLDLADELLHETPEALRGWEWHHLVGRLDESLGSPIPRDWKSPWITYSPDGQMFFVRDGRNPEQRQAVIVDARSGEEVIRLPEADSRCYFTPDQRYVLAMRLNHGIQRWDLHTGELVREVISKPRHDHHNLAINSRLGRYTYHAKESVEIRDADTDELVDTLPGWRHASTYSSDGKVLVLANQTTLEILDAQTHEPLRDPLTFGVQSVLDLEPHPDERILAIGLAGGEVQVIPIDEDSELDRVVLTGLRLPVTKMAWSEDGRQLAAGSTGGDVLVFDVEAGEVMTRLPGHSGWISGLAFVPRSGELMCSDSDGQLRKWSTDLSSKQVLHDHASYVYALDVSPDGAQFLSGGWDGYENRPGGLKLRDARTSAHIAQYGAADEVFLGARYVDDGNAIVASIWSVQDDANEVRVIDALTLQDRLRFDGHAGERVERLVPHPDGRRVLSISTAGEAVFWDITGGEVLASFDALTPHAAFGSGVGIAISPDGRLLAITRSLLEIWLFDAETAELVQHWRAHDEPIWSLAFTPDGSRLLSTSVDDTIRVWDIASAEQVATLVGHGQDVLTVAPSPDGTRIASGGRDGYVRIWDTVHHEEVARLSGHEDYIYALAWAPGGEWLASASGDYTVRVWDTASLLERESAAQDRAALLLQLEEPVARALGFASSPREALRELGLEGRAAQVAHQLVQLHGTRFAAGAPPAPWGPETYALPRATGPVRIDGRMNEAAWNGAPWTEEFTDIEGWRRPAPLHRTRAKLLWDDEFLYVGAYLDEPHLVATLEERDAIIYRDNDFEIFIDPDRDALWYYELEVNALGTLFDLMLDRPYREGGGARIAWDAAGLRHAVALDGTLNDPGDIDQGWSIEFAIPWTIFAEHSHVSLPPEVGDVWKLNFSRVQWQYEVSSGAYSKRPDTPEYNWVWSAQHAINMHLPRRWGLMRFTRER